jgi:hypothetical protein
MGDKARVAADEILQRLRVDAVVGAWIVIGAGRGG